MLLIWKKQNYVNLFYINYFVACVIWFVERIIGIDIEIYRKNGDAELSSNLVEGSDLVLVIVGDKY